MRNSSKKALSAILTLALAIGVFAAAPLPAGALGALALKAAIEGHNHGGVGFLDASVSVAEGNTVTVTGGVTGVQNTLKLDIDAGVKVYWKAGYSGAINNDSSWDMDAIYNSKCMIGLSGAGVFEVTEGGSIVNDGTGYAIYAKSPDGIFTWDSLPSVTVSGGNVSSKGNCIDGRISRVTVSAGSVKSSADAIFAYAVNIQGGSVSGSSAICASSVHVSGGTIASLGQAAINQSDWFSGGAGSMVAVNGGFVFSIYNGEPTLSQGGGADYTEFSTPRPAIRMESGAPSITGGVVCTWNRYGGLFTGYTTGTANDLTTQPASASAKWAIKNGKSGVAYIGATQLQDGSALFVGFYPIDGLTVTEPGYYAVNFYAFAFGRPATQVVASGGKAVRPPDPVWPEHALAAWTYIPGNNPLFIPNANNAVPYDFDSAVTNHITLYTTFVRTEGFPALTGPAEMTLAAGYAATSTAAFTGVNFTADPRFSLDNTYGDKIKWNGETYKLDIAAGLAPGVYPVVITVANFDFANVTCAFTLTVTDAAAPIEPESKKAPSTGNFRKIAAYSPGMFADVDENEWYGDKESKVIANVYEYGLMKGDGAKAFNPEGNITVSEAITVAARVRSIYAAGAEKFTPGEPWYQVYVDYAVSNGIIAAGDFTGYDRPATRAEMAYIFSRSLPEAEMAAKNTVNALPDVNAGTPYYASIVKLYKAGILTGNDADGTFSPGASITRAEAAAVISRVILPDTRMGGKAFG